VVPHANPHLGRVVEDCLSEREVVAGQEPVDREVGVLVFFGVTPGQRRCRGRGVALTSVLLGGPGSDANEALVGLQIGVHPPIALFE
jgi:hypothetical protein